MTTATIDIEATTGLLPLLPAFVLVDPGELLPTVPELFPSSGDTTNSQNFSGNRAKKGRIVRSFLRSAQCSSTQTGFYGKLRTSPLYPVLQTQPI